MDVISRTIKIVHFECSKRKESKIHALNEVAHCNIATENVEVAPATVTMYQRSYKTKVEAVMCRVKLEKFGGHFGFYRTIP